MTMLTEYESCTTSWRGHKSKEAPLSPRTEEDEEPMRLEERKDAPALLQL